MPRITGSWRRQWLAVCVVVIAGGAATVAVDATAEVGFGPEVVVLVPRNTPLSSTLLGTAVADDPSKTYDVVAQPSLWVGGREVARLDAVTLSGVSAPTPFSLAVRPAVVRAVRRAAASVHEHSAALRWSVSATLVPAGRSVSPIALEDTLSLDQPVHSARPTRMQVGDSIFVGSRQGGRGFVSFTAPRAWPRTSRNGSVLPTYGPVRLGGNCTVNILAELDLVAVRALTLPTLRTAGVGGLGQADPVASDIGPARAWAVVIEDPHFVKAVGLVRVARHRYAGLRVYVRLYPTCTPAASRDRALLRGVREIVSRVAARITIRPRAGG